MNDRQKREDDMIIEAKDFLVRRRADFAANPVGMAKIARLEVVVGLIEKNREGQISNPAGAKMNYTLANDAYDAAREIMQEYADFAAIIARTVPASEDKYRMPRGTSKRHLIAAGSVFADNADEDAAVFTANGLPIAETNVDLRGELTALENALRDAAAAKEGGTGETSELEENLKEGKNIVADMTPIVKRTYKGDTATLTAWKTASHVKREPKSDKDDGKDKEPEEK